MEMRFFHGMLSVHQGINSSLMLERAKIILEFEKQIESKTSNVKRFPDYLHMLQPQRALANHESADQWNGRVKAISRQIEDSEKAVAKRLVENARAQDTKHDENMKKLEDKNKGMDTQIQKICDNQDKLSKEVGQVETKLTTTVSKVYEVVDKMANFDTLVKDLRQVLVNQEASNKEQAENNLRQLAFAQKVEEEVRGPA
jgi:chromosome segregation ATPase